MIVRLSDVLASVEEIAPARLALEWDRIGLQVGNPSQPVTHGVCCLDLTLEMAKSLEPETVVVAHHPLIWNPLKSLRLDHVQGQILAELVTKRCAFIAAHTNWDAARGGINDSLCSALGLGPSSKFGTSPEVAMRKIVIFAPKGSEQPIIDAASNAGAGIIGNYTRCGFWTEGIGTFQGGEGSNPAVGQVGVNEEVQELRIEMVVPAERLAKVDRAIRRCHPYEEPAIDVYAIEAQPQHAMGRLAQLDQPMTLKEFRDHVDVALNTRAQTVGRPDILIHKVAVFGGAGGDEWKAAKREGADVLVTGEAKHNVLLEAQEADFPIVVAGHFNTEIPGMTALSIRLGDKNPSVKWKTLMPETGSGARIW